MLIAGVQICCASESAMLKIFDRAYNLNPAENLLYSPYGVEQCFGMIACGAGEQSGRELADVLGIRPAAKKRHPVLRKKLHGQADVNSFNAVLYNRDFALYPEFIRDCREIYGGRIFKLDFSRPEQCVKLLNQLAQKESRGIFDEVFKQDDLKQDDAAVLMNVLYFKAPWLEKFEKYNTEKELFYPVAGTPYKVDMMYSSRELPYFEENGIQAVTLYYQDPAYAMMAIKAIDKNVPLKQVTGFLTQKGIAHIESNSHTRWEVRLWLPKLQLNVKNDLIRLFKKLGMEITFDPIRGDIDKMVIGKPLYVSRAEQLVQLKMDEDGSEVAALTTVDLTVGSAVPGAETIKKEFRADHPFILVLYNRNTKDILLTAAIVKP